MNRDAAVAVIRLISPVFPAETPSETHYLIVRRALNPQDPWSGHFAFPGGRREPGDPDLLSVCLRETLEECGIELRPEHLVAALPLAEAGNALGHRVAVAPFLFELTEAPDIRLDPNECASHHWVPEADLRDPERHATISPLRDSERRFPAVALEDGHIWGFTYKVLADLLDLPHDPVL